MGPVTGAHIFSCVNVTKVTEINTEPCEITRWRTYPHEIGPFDLSEL